MQEDSQVIEASVCWWIIELFKLDNIHAEKMWGMRNVIPPLWLTQWSVKLFMIKAGPKERAGLMPQPV